MHLNLVEAQRSHGKLGALADLARAYVGFHVPRLPWPVGEPTNQRCRLVSSKVTTQRGVVAFLQVENLPSQPPAVRNAEPISLALAPAVEQAATNDESSARRPPLGSVGAET